MTMQEELYTRDPFIKPIMSMIVLRLKTVTETEKH